jgi:hypothetical protein
MGVDDDANGISTTRWTQGRKQVTDDGPHIEKVDARGMDGVGPITLRDGKEDITDVLPRLLGAAHRLWHT